MACSCQIDICVPVLTRHVMGVKYTTLQPYVSSVTIVRRDSKQKRQRHIYSPKTFRIFAKRERDPGSMHPHSWKIVWIGYDYCTCFTPECLFFLCSISWKGHPFIFPRVLFSIPQRPPHSAEALAWAGSNHPPWWHLCNPLLWRLKARLKLIQFALNIVLLWAACFHQAIAHISGSACWV